MTVRAQVTSQSEYDAQSWFYDQDVEIILDGLEERTDYSYIYCYAEDDEDTLTGMVWDDDNGAFEGTGPTDPNRMVAETVTAGYFFRKAVQKACYLNFGCSRFCCCRKVSSAF